MFLCAPAAAVTPFRIFFILPLFFLAPIFQTFTAFFGYPRASAIVAAFHLIEIITSTITEVFARKGIPNVTSAVTGSALYTFTSHSNLRIFSPNI